MLELQNSSLQPSISFVRPCYIAGTGTITSIGSDTVMTAASVKAGISGYQSSMEFFNAEGEAITLAVIPEGVFSFFTVEEEDDDIYSIQYDRIIKLAILAIGEALSSTPIKGTIPLILAVPEPIDTNNYVPLDMLMNKLLKQNDFPFKAEAIRFVSTGRAGVIQGLKIAEDYLYQQGMEFVLVGGSDSYLEASRLVRLDEKERLLAQNRFDGFAAGEAAGFILLTRNSAAAQAENNHIVALAAPGIAQEPGHLYSNEIYKGDGLDSAFKEALSGYTGSGIEVIYSSMNGESHWAKELGVAMMRNKSSFKESLVVEHPVDCYGDLGSATGSVLLGLAATQLLKEVDKTASLIYTSSDYAWRAAVRMEKVALTQLK